MNTCLDCIHKKRGTCHAWTKDKTCRWFVDTTTIFDLPCKVGDTVYRFCEALGAILPYFVETINIFYLEKNQNNYIFEANSHSEYDDELLDSIDFDVDDIGETVFLTREEAEAKLKELSE